MAVKRRTGSIDIVEAARTRVINVFDNGLPVYLSFSAGKDSLCIAHLIYQLIQEGRIDAQQLTVLFVDEEAIFPCIEQMALAWRKKFLLAGAKFDWWCIEVKHFNCFNQLTNDESFVCWDSRKRDVWVRKPPSFAIMSHPQLRPRIDTYQTFIPRVTRDGIMLTGVRAAESVQRLQYMARLGVGAKGITGKNMIFPIFDWKTRDVWLYLKREKVDIPAVYLYMWQAGVGKNALRVSQFFSSDTASSLVRMNEYYPDLMERVIRREPNAYLAALYWDSEMFGRKSVRRKKAEGQSKKDYKALVMDRLTVDLHKYADTKNKLFVYTQYRRMLVKMGHLANDKHYRLIYEALVAGDPKLRTMRAIYQGIAASYADYSKRFRRKKGGQAHG